MQFPFSFWKRSSAVPPFGPFTFGYQMGGISTANAGITEINKLTFAGETTSVLALQLGLPYNFSAYANSTLKGYQMGGDLNNSNTPQTSIQALTFAGETSALLGTSLNLARYQTASVQSSLKGYVEGGFNGGVQGQVQALTFAGETMATLGAGSNVNGDTNARGLSYYLAGYKCGGDSASLDVHKLLYATEAQSSLGNLLTYSTSGFGPVYSATKGYGAGNSLATLTSIFAFTFSLETAATIGATISAVRGQMAGSTSGTIGYWLGGYDSTGNFVGGLKIIEAITYASETTYIVGSQLNTKLSSAIGVWV